MTVFAMAHGFQEQLIEMYQKTRGRKFGAEVKRRIVLARTSLGGYYDAYYLKGQKVARSSPRFREAFEK